MTNTRTDQVAETPLPAEDTEGDFDERGEGASFPIVGVGASAGGLEAFTQLLKHLPADAGMGLVRNWCAVGEPIHDVRRRPSPIFRTREHRRAEWLTSNHVSWPQLDVDLSVESIRNPDFFSLISR